MSRVDEFLVVIPARYESTRLPAKPLIEISGIPMILRTYFQCLKAVEAEKIIVATDHEDIEKLCISNGINVVMTSSSCLTGTDRVAEVALTNPAQTYINIQGDEPLFNPLDLLKLIEVARANPHEVINGYCEIDSEEMFLSSSIPKVVFRPDGKLLYMSRAPIPGSKDGLFNVGHRQVCAYAFPQKTLEAFRSQNTKTKLESLEDIEILRFLELGFEIRMIEMSQDSIAVDLPGDLVKVENEILKRNIS